MIAPITGKLRKRLWLDLSCGLGFGISAAYAYWFVKFFALAGSFTDLTNHRYGIHLKSG
jgi:uncharacterized membrane protein YfhO